MPGAQSYTGVPESQAAAGNPSTATTLVPSTQVPGGTTGTVPQQTGGSVSGRGRRARAPGAAARS